MTSRETTRIVAGQRSPDDTRLEKVQQPPNETGGGGRRARRAAVDYAFASPTGSNEPLYGRTDTKSPMVYSSMVHVAGGEEGSIRQGRLSANARAHSARLGATFIGARIQR